MCAGRQKRFRGHPAGLAQRPHGACTALYAYAERSAERMGHVLEKGITGHRVADFPHVLYSGQPRLAELEISPGDAIWVLEIQVRHPTEAVGAFFEDILLKSLIPGVASAGLNQDRPFD